MNRLHGRFEIANDDFLYVLSTFVFEPIRWNERFGWRRYVEQERLGTFHYWREVGRRMAIKDIPATFDDSSGTTSSTSARTFATARRTREWPRRRETCSSRGSRACRSDSARTRWPR